jgi:putative FmdB family regulatory protein
MPQYSYICDKCGFKFDMFLCSEQRNNTQKCPECLGPAGRNIMDELRNTQFNGQEVTHERWSWSMGVATPEEGVERKREHPELDIRYKFGDYGPLLIKNRKHKKEMMKLHGMEEY